VKLWDLGLLKPGKVALILKQLTNHVAEKGKKCRAMLAYFLFRWYWEDLLLPEFELSQLKKARNG